VLDGALDDVIDALTRAAPSPSSPTPNARRPCAGSCRTVIRTPPTTWAMSACAKSGSPGAALKAPLASRGSALPIRVPLSRGARTGRDHRN
jgi:hypothetical protein